MNFRRDLMDKAVAAHRRAVELASRPLFHLNLGAAHENLGDEEAAAASYRRAIDGFRQAGAEGAQPALAHDRLGQLLQRRGDAAGAVEALAAAVRHDPEAATYRLHLAQAYAAAGSTAAAVAEYRRALELRPTLGAARYGLGNLLIRLGHRDEGREHLRRFRALGERGDVLRELEIALRADPGNAALHVDLARALSDLGRQDEALQEAMVAVALAPDSAAAHLWRGRILIRRGEWAAAGAALRRTLEVTPATAPEHARALDLLGSVYLTQGRLDAARTALQRALELDPDLPPAHFNLGMTWRRLGRPEDAIASLQRAIAVSEGYPLASLELAQLYQQDGMPDSAVAVLEAALARDSTDSQLRFELSQAYLLAGRVREAHETLSGLREE